MVTERESAYRNALSDLLRREPNRAARRSLLREERLTPDYQQAWEAMLAGRRLKNRAVQMQGEGLFPERPPTAQEEVSRWATETLDEYNRLPITSGKERRKTTDFVINIACNLLANPEKIDTAVSLWKTYAGQPFYDVVKKASENEARKNWQNLTGEQLAELVKVYAHSELASEFAESILSHYFRGPNNQKQRIDGLYTFVYGIIDLIEDTKALGEGLKIAQFENPILPRESDFYLDFVAARHFALDDDKLLQKAINIDTIPFDLNIFTSIDGVRLIKQTSAFFDTNSRLQKRLERESEKVIRRLGLARAQARIEALTVFNRDPNAQRVVVSASARLRKANQWPYSLLMNSNDRLRRKYFEQVAPWVGAEHFRRDLQRRVEDQGGETLVFISIPTPQGQTVDIGLPGGIAGARRAQIIEKVLEEVSGWQKEQAFVEDRVLPSMVFTNRNYGNVRVFFSLRRAVLAELSRHPFSALDTIGFPIPKLGIDGDIVRVNQEISESIRAQQVRFLNKRGVRIPLVARELKNLGYTHIDFHKDEEDPEKITVRIFVGEIPYSVKLDRYFNFDFEGKRFDAPVIRETLRCLVLALLRPVLCHERIKGPTGVDVDEEERDLVSRMGHLRLLPSGLHRTNQAKQNCQSFEGKDLIILDAQKREALKRQGRVISDEQQFTYVKPVIEKEENLPPIVLHLPGLVQFQRE